MKAIKRMQKAAADRNVRAIMEYREKAARDEADRLSFAHEKGIKLGKEEGIMIGKEEGLMIGEMRGKEEGIMIGEKRGKEEGIMIGEKRAMERVALKMLSLKISTDEIAKATGLSKTDIMKLKQ